jgi:hypothetical protein
MVKGQRPMQTRMEIDYECFQAFPSSSHRCQGLISMTRSQRALQKKGQSLRLPRNIPKSVPHSHAHAQQLSVFAPIGPLAPGLNAFGSAKLWGFYMILIYPMGKMTGK